MAFVAYVGYGEVMLTCFVLAAQIATGQIVPTRPASFLVHDGVAYVASPTYAVKSVGPDERFWLSPDGARLAFITATGSDTPSAQARRLAKGESPHGTQRLGVWSRDTGRIRDVFTTTDPTLGFDKIAFLGHDLVFTTYSEKIPFQLWFAPESGSPRRLDIAGLTNGMLLAASRRRPAIAIADGTGLWIVNQSGARKLPTPEGASVMLYGVTRDDRAVLDIGPKEGGSMGRQLLDFATGAIVRAEGEPVQLGSLEALAFIPDLYRNHPGKGGSSFTDLLRTNVDTQAAPLDEEDGGLRLDLVERTGASRRRIMFAADLALSIRGSDDGLALAFVSNGVLMVRYLVPCDAATTKRLLGRGS